MWVETIDGSVININTLVKIEVEHQNAVTIPPGTKVIQHEIDTENMTPEEKAKLDEAFDKMLEDTGLSEDKYEIRAWSANDQENPHILFRGKKEDCKTEFTELKRKKEVSEKLLEETSQTDAESERHREKILEVAEQGLVERELELLRRHEEIVSELRNILKAVKELTQLISNTR